MIWSDLCQTKQLCMVNTEAYFYINVNIFKYVKICLSDNLISVFIPNKHLGSCQQQMWQCVS